VHERTEIASVIGTRHIEAVELKARNEDEKLARSNGDGERGRAEVPPRRVLPVSAVFVFIGAEPHINWLPDTIARDEKGFLLTGADAVRSGRWPLTNRAPCPLETTLPGVLAAGDVRSGSTKRVGFAVGDGSLAVTCAHQLRAQSA